MTQEASGPIAWMIRHRVAANLVMLFLLVGGAVALFQIRQEVFPEYDLDIVIVTVPYPSASPEEVEQGVLLAIEDELRGVDGIKKVTSFAREGEGIVLAELMLGEDGPRRLQDAKNAVDRIQSFPEQAERPIVALAETKSQVLSLILYGDRPPRLLRRIADDLREKLLQLDEVTLVELPFAPDWEISVEVPQGQLRSHNLTLGQVAGRIRRTALDLPGGAVRSASGEVLLRTKEKRLYASEFANIPLLSRSSGDQLLLGDIATIRDRLEDTDKEAYYNGLPAIRIDIFRTGDLGPIEISDAVHEYVDQLEIAEGIDVAIWNDWADIYRQRIGLLAKNALLGLCLVLLLLALFLEPKLAFWVTSGILVSIVGSFLFLPFTGATLNMVSLFAFILTLGIVVDDAIVVGEMVYQRREKGYSRLEAAVFGAREIAMPVTFAVLTNVAAFLPLFFVPGTLGKLFLQIPSVVVTVFLLSLFESLFILPAHLAHSRPVTGWLRWLNDLQKRVNRGLRGFINGIYLPFLRKAVRAPHFTLACGASLLVLALCAVLFGHVPFTFLPKIDSDIVIGKVELPFGAPISQARKAGMQLERSAREALKELGAEDQLVGIYTQIGESLEENGPDRRITEGGSGAHLIGLQVYLDPSTNRAFSGQDFADLWREKTGQVAGAELVSFDAALGTGGGRPVEFALSHPDPRSLDEAALLLAEQLAQVEGVQDIDSGVKSGKPQLSFRLKPAGESLGLTVADLASQVRGSYYGIEALRQQRGRNEVKVMVRLPEEDRKRLYSLEHLVIRSSSGKEISLSDGATITKGRADTQITRRDGRRTVSVNADIDGRFVTSDQVVELLEEEMLPAIRENYPALQVFYEGELRQQEESLGALKVGFVFSLLAIYTLMALPFASYVQPFVVMLSIPFGLFGAVVGHALLGYEISLMSLFGMIALSGVVVNDSLVLLVTANKRREEKGESPSKAIVSASIRRFRPIMLTSLTTFFGLSPMIFETSLQAQFLVPMAVALGFGLLFATGLILILVPAIYVLVTK